MYWSVVDEGLIRRGVLLLGLDFLEGCDAELTGLNVGKVGLPFKITVSYVEFLTVVRYLFSMPYRQLEGFTRALSRLIPKLPSVDYSWVRRRILRLNPSLRGSLRGSRGSITIAVDSSGVSVHKSGGWVTRVHGKKKRYIKIHFAVDVKTKEVLAMEVTTDDVHDSEAALIKDASKLRRFSEAVMDGAYDNAETYNLLRRMSVKPIIKPRHNARADRGPPERRRAVRIIKRISDEGWARMVGYGKRWAVKTAFSTFKRIFDDYCIAKELEIKAFVYATIINLTLKTKRQTRNND